MPAPFRFDRTWTFGVPPTTLWGVLSRPGDYPRWWTWLRHCDADGFHEGTTARCVVQAPLPYSLRFTIRVVRLVPGAVVETQVEGDLAGPAALRIGPAENGDSTARLSWELELRDPVLRRLARVARPAMVWAHDRVVDGGVSQFRRRALRATA